VGVAKFHQNKKKFRSTKKILQETSGKFEGFEGQRVHKPSKNWQGMIKSFA